MILFTNFIGFVADTECVRDSCRCGIRRFNHVCCFDCNDHQTSD